MYWATVPAGEGGAVGSPEPGPMGLTPGLLQEDRSRGGGGEGGP